MLQKGIDVHYILVEYFQGIDALQKKLMNITENDRDLTLAQWAKNLRRKSLLILDNVDGSYWIQTKMRHNLQNKFIKVLQSNSRKIKILITSQKKNMETKSVRVTNFQPWLKTTVLYYYKAVPLMP